MLLVIILNDLLFVLVVVIFEEIDQMTFISGYSHPISLLRPVKVNQWKDDQNYV